MDFVLSPQMTVSFGKSFCATLFATIKFSVSWKFILEILWLLYDFDFHDDPRQKEDIPAATEYNIRISISCLSSDGLFLFSDIDLKTIINKSRDWVFRN